MEINFIIGLMGMSFILVAFVLDEFYKKFGQETIQYNVLNIIGSGLMTIYALTIKSWPFVILNSVWMVVATVKLIGILEKGKKGRKK